jgi:hypothetical protein
LEQDRGSHFPRIAATPLFHDKPPCGGRYHFSDAALSEYRPLQGLVVSADFGPGNRPRALDKTFPLPPKQAKEMSAIMIASPQNSGIYLFNRKLSSIIQYYQYLAPPTPQAAPQAAREQAISPTPKRGLRISCGPFPGGDFQDDLKGARRQDRRSERDEVAPAAVPGS